MIDFSHDPTVTEALKQWRGRAHFPTDLSSAQLRQVAQEVRERAVFSARMTNAEAVQRLADVVDDMLGGKINLATARWEMMKELARLGYDPEQGGFPQDMAGIPPAERGSLRDLSSRRRLDLMLETNQRMAANYGRVVEGNSEYALWAYPGWKLVRLYAREIERGSPESKTAGWEERWHAAGESVQWEGAAEETMVALKDSPIWPALGSGAGGYKDAIGNPYPPFAFQSGMGWDAAPREECDKLGLLKTGDRRAKTGKMRASLSPGAQEVNAAFERMAPDLQAALRKELLAA
jgi:hypothetical protein